MTRPRMRTHLRKNDGWAACGILSPYVRMSDVEADVDCGHCVRIINRSPAPQKFSGKARWWAMKELAERHPDEYAALLYRATHEVREMDDGDDA